MAKTATKKYQRKKPRKNTYVFRSSINGYINNDVLVAPPPPEPNKALCLHINANSDEELVRRSNYKFNSSVEILINDSETSRFAASNRKRGVKKVPRRQNAWILYRRDKSVIPKFGGLTSAHISKEISKMWDNESRETIELFEALARMAVKRHKERYGENYKYNPVQKKSSGKEEGNQNEPLLTPSPSEILSLTSPISTISSSFEDPSQELTMNLNLKVTSDPAHHFFKNIYLSYYTN
ncbi:hypothetical protein C1645_765225 [Glomus cerebriforme]|uniref:HMG box domain-containing protein n=1 Tax=Glomus cerebriforme TaxID=658196 RepID=A0A397T822_9GLOM|nr:hypothetical protein C1645_765225 [Glomus cerebriforme]